MLYIYNPQLRRHMIYTYVYMYVCMYLYIYIHIYAYIYIHTRELQNFGRLTRVRASFAPASTRAYVSIRQHTSAYVIIRQHTSARVARVRAPFIFCLARFCERLSRPHDLTCFETGAHTSAYVSIRQHTSAYAPFLRAVFPTIRACLLRDRRARLMRAMRRE